MRSTRRAGSTARLAQRAAALALLASGAGAVAACSFVDNIGPETCDRSASGNPAARYTEGTVTNGVYMTSAWNGWWLYFPGGMRYRLVHQLGGTPTYWQAYLSFNEYGFGTGADGGSSDAGDASDAETPDPDSIALAAGNMVEVKDINETDMLVVNATCSDYWLLVVAGGAGTE